MIKKGYTVSIFFLLFKQNYNLHGGPEAQIVSFLTHFDCSGCPKKIVKIFWQLCYMILTTGV